MRIILQKTTVCHPKSARVTHAAHGYVPRRSPTGRRKKKWTLQCSRHRHTEQASVLDVSRSAAISETSRSVAQISAFLAGDDSAGIHMIRTRHHPRPAVHQAAKLARTIRIFKMMNGTLSDTMKSTAPLRFNTITARYTVNGCVRARKDEQAKRRKYEERR